MIYIQGLFFKHIKYLLLYSTVIFVHNKVDMIHVYIGRRIYADIDIDADSYIDILFLQIVSTLALERQWKLCISSVGKFLYTVNFKNVFGIIWFFAIVYASVQAHKLLVKQMWMTVNGM